MGRQPILQIQNSEWPRLSVGANLRVRPYGVFAQMRVRPYGVFAQMRVRPYGVFAQMRVRPNEQDKHIGLSLQQQ